MRSSVSSAALSSSLSASPGDSSSPAPGGASGKAAVDEDGAAEAHGCLGVGGGVVGTDDRRQSGERHRDESAHRMPDEGDGARVGERLDGGEDVLGVDAHAEGTGQEA